MPQPPDDLAACVRNALAEDVGAGDLSAALLGKAGAHRVRAEIITREAGVLCGAPHADEVFRQTDNTIHADWHQRDGDRLVAGDVLVTLDGPAAAILTGERTALNFLQTLSGVASLTRRYVEAVAGTRARVLDTRKTLPGLRTAQKYAVRCGGGHNHRMGLYDAILIKENHIIAAGSLAATLESARAHAAQARFIEIEVESLEELRAALAAGATHVLLDDFALPDLREAVRLASGRARVEVSGSVTLDTIRAIAECGVDDISVGALTKHVRALDLSLRLTG